MFIKISILKKLPSGKWRLYSKKKGPDGQRKNLGTFDSLGAAKKHEADVHFFKSHSEDGETDDFDTNILKRMSSIGAFLEEAGFIDSAKLIHRAMDAVDGSFDNEDNLIDMFGLHTDQQYNTGGPRGEPGPYSGGAGDAPSLLSMDAPTLRGCELIEKLVKIANILDIKGLYAEADILDEELTKIIQELEETQAKKKTQKTEPEKEKEKQKEDAVVRSNGKDGTSVTDNSNCGMFQGLSDSYMYRGYGNLEGAYGPTDK